jgi:hypothetical protein
VSDLELIVESRKKDGVYRELYALVDHTRNGILEDAVMCAVAGNDDKAIRMLVRASGIDIVLSMLDEEE